MEADSMRVPRPGLLRRKLGSRKKSSQLSTALVDQILATYDLGELIGARTPTIDRGRSRNLILEFSEKQVILKQYKLGLSNRAIIFEHSLLRYLATLDFCAPRLVLNRLGETLTKVDSRYYALTDFVNGYMPYDYFITSWSKRHMVEQVAATLASYHHAVKGFTPQGRKVDGFINGTNQRWREVEWYLDQYAEYKSLLKAREQVGSNEELFFLQNLDRLCLDLIDLNGQLSATAANLSRTIVHGDYGPYNLLIENDEVTAVLDFENAHLEWRASDVIGAIFRFGARKNRINYVDATDGKRMPRAMNYDLAQTFFSSYQSQYPLSAEEIASATDIFRFVWIRGLNTYLQDHFSEKSGSRLDRARHHVWWIDWMRENAQSLTDAMLAF